MIKNALHTLIFLAGLLVVAWIGFGYLGNNPLGAAVAALIAVCYLAGALELWRFRRASASIEQALDQLQHSPPSLEPWLALLPPALRVPLRLRIEGERVAVPGLSLTPYLVGLLVLLGMLGTLLGMMGTLRGTAMALESASDLQAIRGSLAAPVKGLGFAFGTSIAGVASSAMLGLLAALCRRERAAAMTRLDACISGVLRPFSRARRREQGEALLAQQTALMPQLLDRMQAMMAALEQQQASGTERQLASQQDFHRQTEATYLRLAEQVEQTLSRSMAQSVAAAGDAVQPLIAATMQGLEREASNLREALQQHTREQQQASTELLHQAIERISLSQRDAGSEQQRLHTELAQHLRDAQQQSAQAFEQRSSELLQQISTRLADTSTTLAEHWQHALSAQAAANQQLAEQQQQHGKAAHDALQEQASQWLASVQQTHAALQTAQQHNDEARLQTWSQQLAAISAELHAQWRNSAEQASQQQQAIVATLAQTTQDLASAASGFKAQADGWRDDLQQAHIQMQAALEARDSERLEHWNQRMHNLGDSLRSQWQQAADQAAQQQQHICSTLEHTAAALAEQAKAHATDTIDAIGPLVEAASAAPKLAAEVMGELREQLSASMVRDTAMLEERSQLMGTVSSLLEALQSAASDQRKAIDELLATSAQLLERAGTQWSERLNSETAKLEQSASEVAASAIEVAAIGNAFEAGAVAMGNSQQALLERLEQIGTALEQAMQRSDEQLAYYVAQAREVVDLSVLSQKQMIEELQQLGGRSSSEPA